MSSVNKLVKHPIPEYKKEEIKNLVELINSNNTIMLASIKSLPAKQFQQIKKSLRGKSEVIVTKKRALARSIEDSKKEGVKELLKHLKEDNAVLISNEDAFDLAAILAKNKSPVKAKPGQESDQDIEIEAGVTEIPAGPAVSELGAVGLQVKVTDGKIEIMKSSIIVKKGDIVSDEAASVMGKLDITPFEVGFHPEIAYDTKSNKLFTTLTIDKDQLLSDMKNMFTKAKSFAVSLGYYTKDTIGFLLGKANSQEQSLSKHIKETVEEKTETSESDESKESEEEKVETSDEQIKEEPNEEVKEDNAPEETKSEEETK